jgi:DNA-binding beta-propeller fold protein YncE
VSDFIAGLRADLVDAAARQQRGGTVGRAARPLHPRAWRPAAVLGVAALAVSIAAIAVALVALAPPGQQSGRPHVIAQVRVGGQPQDATIAGGSLWIAEFGGHVVRVDLADRRVASRIAVGGSPTSIAAGGAGVWVMSTDEPRSQLSLIDSRTGRRVDRVPVGGYGGAIAVGAGGLWLFPNLHRGGLERIDPASTAVTAQVPFGEGAALAATGDTLWALGADGTIVAVDGNSGRIVDRLTRAISLPDAAGPENALVADANGAWAIGNDDTLLRIVGGRVAQRITARSALGPLALSDGAVWVATGDTPRFRYGLSQIDPDTGKTTATLDLGHHLPRALVPSPQGLWVIADDGTALLVHT